MTPPLKLLFTAFAVIGMTIFSAAGVTTISDSLIVTENPIEVFGALDQINIVPLVIASASASEADENGQNTVHFVTFTGTDIHFPGNPGGYNNATALIDPNGEISDIFGTWLSGEGTDLNPFTYSVAFISDPDPSLLTLNNGAFGGFGTITTRLPENQDSYNATGYLGVIIGITDGDEFPYTATFVSDREVPVSGTTFSLLGMAVTGLAFLRRKLS